MRPFLLWCSIAFALIAGSAFALHVHQKKYGSEHIAIIVDSSYPMHTIWSTLPARLEALFENERYKKFSLLTEKNALHHWQDTPDFSMLPPSPFAPRDWEKVKSGAIDLGVLKGADRTILITNAKSIKISTPFSVIDVITLTD